MSAFLRCFSLAALTGCAFPALRFNDAGATDATTLDAPETTPDAVDATPEVASVNAPTPSCPAPSGPECERVLIEGATFSLGIDGTAQGPAQRTITVSPVVFDATEVTVRRFRRFQRAMETSAPERFEAVYPDAAHTRVSIERAPITTLAETGSECTFSDAVRSEARESHPINCVSWPVAMAFCIWDGGRLPTEAEYERVARWWRAPAQGRTYPWGESAPDCARAQWQSGAINGDLCPGDDMLGTRRVASLVGGAISGVYDLAGNAGEWTADNFVPYASPASPNECWGRGVQVNPLCYLGIAADHTVRGGNWSTRPMNPEQLSTSARSGATTRSLLPTRGFRCVRGL